MSKYLLFFPYVGGKFYMLKHILSLMPKHRIYVEVFGGSGKVLLNKPESEIEIWNDYDRKIANLFHVIVFQFEEFFEKVSGLVYSRELYKEYLKELKELNRVELGNVDVAVKTYYVLRCRFSGGVSSWRQGGFCFSRKDNHAKRYWRRLEELERIRERLSNVIIECDDFENVIKRWDGEDVFMFIDPPYYVERASEYYSGFSKEDHKRLLRLLKEVKCKWLLSGYANELYDEELSNYNRFEVEVVKHSYHNKGVETKPRAVEVLWCNYDIGACKKNFEEGKLKQGCGI